MILISKLLNIPFKRFRIWYAVFVNFGLHFIHVSYILWISFFSNFKFSCILLVYHAGKFPQNACRSCFHHYLMHLTFFWISLLGQLNLIHKYNKNFIFYLSLKVNFPPKINAQAKKWSNICFKMRILKPNFQPAKYFCVEN